MHEKLGPSQETVKVRLLIEATDSPFPLETQVNLLKEKDLYIGVGYDINLCPREIIVSGRALPQDLAQLGYTRIRAIPAEADYASA